MARSQKEEEEKTLKAITLFCFPEGINWAPLTEYHRLVLHPVLITKKTLSVYEDEMRAEGKTS